MTKTIYEVIREWRAVLANDEREEFTPLEVEQLLNRIDASYKEQLTNGTMCTMSCRTDGELLQQYAESEKRLVAEVAKLRNELAAEMHTCERLRAALGPILAHDCAQYGHGRGQPEIVRIVREAQRIIKGGEGHA